MTAVIQRHRATWSAADLDARVDAGEPFPIVDGELCTFAFRGPAIGVRLVHFGVGLPDDLSFELARARTATGGLLTLAMPYGSRLEYKLEVTDSFGTRLVEDPLNRLTASHPFGANSVCEAAGYATPEWAIERDDVPRGTIRDLSLDSVALGRRAGHLGVRAGRATARPQRRAIRCVIVHDGPDYLRYAAATTVVDNLIHGGVIPPTVVAFVHPAERLVEYADDARHHGYLTNELLPQLEAELPAGGEPGQALPRRRQLRCRRVVVGGDPGSGDVRAPAVAVRFVRRRRNRLLAAPRGAVAADQAVRSLVRRQPVRGR